MKSIFLSIVITIAMPLAATSAFAIGNESARHEKVIKTAIASECGYAGALKIESQSVTERRIDQGILDFDYVTTLRGTLGNTYTVESTRSDSYDHNENTWGSYYVDSVICGK